MGGAGPSMAWGGGQFDPHFLTAPGGLLGHVFFSILIIIMFKGNIRDYLEKKSGQYLKNWPRYCNFCRPKEFLKILRFLFFKLKITVTRPFLKILSSSFLLTSPFLEYKKILR